MPWKAGCNIGAGEPDNCGVIIIQCIFPRCSVLPSVWFLTVIPPLLVSPGGNAIDFSNRIPKTTPPIFLL
jgi:hypothetical protein